MAREATPQRIELHDVAFRYSDYDTPFWARSSSSPARWHVPADGPTQYLSMSVEGAWAELIRAEALRSEDEVAMVRMPMWAAQIDQALLADYSTFDQAEAAGFSPEALVDEDWGRCQREGARLRRTGYAGVVAPSAALAGAMNVTLFGPRYAATWGSRPALSHAVPTYVIARGAPPEGLVGRTRHRGDVHAGLAEWQRARRSRRKSS